MVKADVLAPAMDCNAGCGCLSRPVCTSNKEPAQAIALRMRRLLQPREGQAHVQ